MPRILSLWYVASVGSASFGPYLAVILKDRGFDDARIASLYFFFPLAALLGGPIWSYIADRLRSPRTVVLIAATGTILGATTLLGGHTTALIATGVVLYSSCSAPQQAIVDTITVRALPDGLRRYGPIRAWGSLAFLLGVLINGWTSQSLSDAPLILGWLLLLGACIVTFWLPNPSYGPTPSPLQGIYRIGRSRPLMTLLVVCALHGIGLTTYDKLYSLHVDHLGLPRSVLGLAIATGVGIEIPVLFLSKRLLEVTSPATLLLLGVGTSIPRWFFTSEIDSAHGQIALQLIHGMTYGTYWVAGVALFAKNAPKGLESSTQSLLAASTYGVGHLLSSGIASYVLLEGTPADLFKVVTGTSVLATLGALWVWRQEHRSQPARPTT